MFEQYSHRHCLYAWCVFVIMCFGLCLYTVLRLTLFSGFFLLNSLNVCFKLLDRIFFGVDVHASLVYEEEELPLHQEKISKI